MNTQRIVTLLIATLLALAVGCTDLEAEAQKLYKEAMKQEKLVRIESAPRDSRINRTVVRNTPW